MQAWALRFASVFGLGLVIYVSAIGVGAATGALLSDTPVLRSLRYLGGGLQVAGLALWIAKARIERDRPGLNPMFGLLLSFGTILLLIGLIVTAASGELFLLALQAGLASAGAAVVIGLLAMLIAPGEGQTSYDYPWMAPDFDPDEDAYAAGMIVPTKGYGAEDDLTRIKGIDDSVASVLRAANIHYFSQLANTSPDGLREILEDDDKSGVDTTTWPEQAILAANGDWRALERLQSRLNELETEPA